MWGVKLGDKITKFLVASLWLYPHILPTHSKYQTVRVQQGIYLCPNNSALRVVKLSCWGITRVFNICFVDVGARIARQKCGRMHSLNISAVAFWCFYIANRIPFILFLNIRRYFSF